MILSVPLREEKQEQKACSNTKFLMKNNCTIKKFRTIQKVDNNQMFDKSYLSYLFQIKTTNKLEILRGGGCCSSCSNCIGYNNNNNSQKNEQQTYTQQQNKAWIEQFLNQLFQWAEGLKQNQLEEISKIWEFQKSYIIIDEFTQQNQQNIENFPDMVQWVNNISSLLKSNDINGYIKFQLLIISNQFIKLQSMSRKNLGNEWKNKIINIFEQHYNTYEIIFWQIPIEYEISFLKQSLQSEKKIQNQSQPQSLNLFSDQSLPQVQGASVSKDFEIYKIKCTFQNQLLSFLNKISQQNYYKYIKRDINDLFQWFDTNIKYSLNSSVQYYWMKFIIDLITFCAIDIYEMKNEEDRKSIEKGNKIKENKETNENFEIKFGIKQLQLFLSSIDEFVKEKKNFNLYNLIRHIQNVDQKIKQQSNYLFNKLFKRFLHLYLQISNNSYENSCSKNFQSLLFQIIYVLNEIDQCITMTWAKLIKIQLILKDQFNLREKLNTINQVEKQFKQLYEEFTKNYQDITLYWFQQLIKLHVNQNNQEQLEINQSFQIEIYNSIQILEKILSCLNQDFQDKLKFDFTIELNFRYTFFQESSIHGIQFQWFFLKFIEILIQEFEQIIGKDKNIINNSIIQVVLDSIFIMIGILKLLSNQLEVLKFKMDSSQNIDKFNDIKNKMENFKKDFEQKIQDKITSTDEAKAQEFQQDLYNLLVKSCMFYQTQIQEIEREKDKIINLINDISNQDDSTKNERKKKIYHSQKIIIDIIQNSYNDFQHKNDLTKKKLDKLIEYLNQIIKISHQYRNDYQNKFKVDIQYFFDNLKINLKKFRNDFNLCFINLLNCNFNNPEIKSTIQLIQKKDIQNIGQEFDKLNCQLITKIRQIFNNQDSFLEDHLGYFLINASNIVSENEFQEMINQIINQTRISDKMKKKLKKETQNQQRQIQTQNSLQQKEKPINEEEIKIFFNTIFSSIDQ